MLVRVKIYITLPNILKLTKSLELRVPTQLQETQDKRLFEVARRNFLILERNAILTDGLYRSVWPYECEHDSGRIRFSPVRLPPADLQYTAGMIADSRQSQVQSRRCGALINGGSALVRRREAARRWSHSMLVPWYGGRALGYRDRLAVVLPAGNFPAVVFRPMAGRGLAAAGRPYGLAARWRIVWRGSTWLDCRFLYSIEYYNAGGPRRGDRETQQPGTFLISFLYVRIASKGANRQALSCNFFLGSASAPVGTHVSLIKIRCPLPRYHAPVKG